MYKKPFFTLFLILTLSLVFSCSKPETAPKAETPAPVETEKPAETVFRIANGSEPQSLDPAFAGGDVEHHVIIGLFEGLVTPDPETNKPIPGLAESWEISEDKTIYTFHLRDAQWSDGKPVTADDVVYSWIRELAPETAAPYSWFPAMFIKNGEAFTKGECSADEVGVKALDEKTVQLELVGPLPYALGALTHFTFYVVPQHCIEKWGSSWTSVDHIVCNGPFVLDKHIPQTSITLTPNPLYWDKENVHLDKVVLYSSDDDNTNFNMYLNNELDWDLTIPIDQLANAKMRSDFNTHPMLGSQYYIFNTQNGVLKDWRVRKALTLALDREELVDQVTKGNEEPAYGLVPPLANYDCLDNPGSGDFDEDVKKAQELLAEAGYPGGVGFPVLTVIYNTNENHKMICEYIQYQWKENLGIDLKLENQEWQTYLDTKHNKAFEIVRGGWIGDYQDPNTFLDMFISDSIYNSPGFASEEYDALIKQASMMDDCPERSEVLRKADEVISQDQAAILPLYFPVSQNMIDCGKWGGWHNNTQNVHPLKGIYRK